MKRSYYYMLLGGVSNKLTWDEAEKLHKIRLLSIRYHRQNENDCNGQGFVGGKWYIYDGNTPGAYLPDGETSIFSAEMDKIQEKITDLLPCGFSLEMQGDPRGREVILHFGGKNVSDFVHNTLD